MEKPLIPGNELIRHYRHGSDDYNRALDEWAKYIDSKYNVGYTEENTCITRNLPDGEIQMSAFGITAEICSMYGKMAKDIKKCQVTIVEDHVKILDYTGKKKIEYFGWVDYLDDDENIHNIIMIQPCAEMFAMQFPGGSTRESEIKHGKVVRLKIDLI